MKIHMKLLGLMLLLCFLVGCGINEVEPNSENASNEILIEETVPPSPAPTPTPQYEYTALLTGIPIELENKKRPIAILINNLKPARPQSGLHEADIVWEVLAEGGITRLVAIFQSTALDELEIGPVRSNRPYFIDIADSYQAVIAHAGASNDAYAILQKNKKSYLDEISNAGPAYWRSSERKAPHNLYTNLAKLREQMTKKGYEEEATITGYAYDYNVNANAPVGAVTALDVIFQMQSYKVSYEFDMENKQYIRLVNDEQHKDKDSSTVLTAKNLLFLQTKHTVLDNEGRLEVDLKSGGDALAIIEGHATELKWVKANDGMIRFSKEGEEFKLLPGKTFIHVLPTGKDLKEQVIY